MGLSARRSDLSTRRSDLDEEIGSRRATAFAVSSESLFKKILVCTHTKVSPSLQSRVSYIASLSLDLLLYSLRCLWGQLDRLRCFVRKTWQLECACSTAISRY